MEHFKWSRLKINRAEKHIADLKTILGSIPDRYISTIEINPQSGGQSLKYVLPDEDMLMQNVALITGDAIHNLRAALDYAWVGTIERFFPGTSNRHTKFPVGETEVSVKGQLNSRGIETTVPNLFKRVISDIKPYSGGNDAFFRLHHLDISDKHHLMIPVVNAVGINGIVVENESGETVPGSTYPVTDRSPHFVNFPPDWHIKDKGKPTIAVMFENGLAMQYLEVGDTLSTFVIFTLQAVEILQHTY